MRNRKTGCSRCRRHVCCCPRAASTSGPSTFLKFAGSVPITPIIPGPPVFYLTDSPLGYESGGDVSLHPVNYLIPVPSRLQNLFVYVREPIAEDTTLLFETLLDGVPIPGFAVSFSGTPAEATLSALTPVMPIQMAQRLDLRLTITRGVIAVGYNVSATMGCG